MHGGFRVDGRRYNPRATSAFFVALSAGIRESGNGGNLPDVIGFVHAAHVLAERPIAYAVTRYT